jgi:hypothetical protein
MLHSNGQVGFKSAMDNNLAAHLAHTTIEEETLPPKPKKRPRWQAKSYTYSCIGTQRQRQTKEPFLMQALLKYSAVFMIQATESIMGQCKL